MASCIPGRDTAQDEDGDDDNRGSQNNNNDGDLHITPNPVQASQMNLSVNSGENARARLQIVSPTGVPVQVRELNLVTGPNQVRLDATQLRQGVYSVILYWASGRVSIAKFIRL
jgi:hypothetical protein